MDCETARLFLHFDRPGENDRDGPEADELRAHLEQCSGCNAQAQAARRLDQHLGRAMRAVEVPAGLRARLLERLAADRRLLRRRRVGRLARWVSVAACLALLVWAGWAVCNPRQKYVSPDEVVHSYNVAPYDLAKANTSLHDLAGLFPAPNYVSDTLSGGERSCAPDFVRYDYLVGGPSFAELPGYSASDRSGYTGGKYPKVPQLVFAHPRGPQRAVIYVLDNRRFRVGEVSGASGYTYQLDKRAEKDFTYLILHNGQSIGAWKDWLEVAEDE